MKHLMESQMAKLASMLTIGFGVLVGGRAAQGQQTPLKMTLFGQPSVNNDAIWMAIEKGLYQQEGLDLTYRLFPSGTTAFQAFQTGQGDIVMTGDLPSVQYFFRVKGDYRTIAAIERTASPVAAIGGAARGSAALPQKAIAKPQDLVDKKIGRGVARDGG